MTSAVRPRPQPSPITEDFWAAARSHVLVRPVCDECGRSHFTPQVACPWCLSTAWTYSPSTGQGVVYSHTTVHRPPVEGFEVPYVLAVVDLDEGWHMLTNIVDCEPGDVRMGMPVAVQWQRLDDDFVLPVFAPRRDA